jgi:hypothetical protein
MSHGEGCDILSILGVGIGGYGNGVRTPMRVLSEKTMYFWAIDICTHISTHIGCVR